MMRNNLIFNNTENKTIVPDETLKATTLLYLKEALRNEEFEECAQLIKTAKGFGAQQEEILWANQLSRSPIAYSTFSS